MDKIKKSSKEIFLTKLKMKILFAKNAKKIFGRWWKGELTLKTNSFLFLGGVVAFVPFFLKRS